jgi:threonine/homoserine/homoserine lactone efflux protein
MTAQSAWALVSVSFIMALSGAVMPGPLLTYTIARTVKTPVRGFLTGPLAIAGHAVIEMAILTGLVFGVTEFLKQPAVIKVIGVAGALLLGYMGIGLIREVFRSRDTAVAEQPGPAGSAGPTGSFGPAGSSGPAAGKGDSLVTRMNPVLAGAILSMSNPYWWVWWITVGSATLIRFGVSITAWQGVLLFFIGHELGDLGWYSTISLLTHFGRRMISRRLYNVILAVCGAAIICFGLYLGVSPFLGRR